MDEIGCAVLPCATTVCPPLPGVRRCNAYRTGASKVAVSCASQLVNEPGDRCKAERNCKTNIAEMQDKLPAIICATLKCDVERRQPRGRKTQPNTAAWATYFGAVMPYLHSSRLSNKTLPTCPTCRQSLNRSLVISRRKAYSKASKPGSHTRTLMILH